VNRAYAAVLRDRRKERAQELADAIVPPDAKGFLAGGVEALSAAREAIAFVSDVLAGPAEELERRAISLPLSSVMLLPPVTDPAKIICIGRNYKEHAEEAGQELPKLPIFFTRFAATLVAHGEPIVRPRVSEQLDWEGELAVVIGERCRYVTAEKAFEVVAGYSIFNDVTVRDYQRRVPQWTAGKNFVSTGPFGPNLVTADEVGDPQSLDLRVSVNGETVQSANTEQMIFDIATQIAHITEFVELEPGDVVVTGTPSGVGFVREPPRFLRPGDVVRVEIDGLGALENPVIDDEVSGEIR
jgi:2-keto-4-pentenoate hydratase/2-oxohepta-3-ene-1,7-dioic acid hydratase in catechol pathway